jgi:hypothetical protein
MNRVKSIAPSFSSGLRRAPGLKPGGGGSVGIVIQALKRVAIDGELNPICE